MKICWEKKKKELMLDIKNVQTLVIKNTVTAGNNAETMTTQANVMIYVIRRKHKLLHSVTNVVNWDVELKMNVI